MKRVWIDALLVVVTMGFYIPIWLWWRNKELREANPTLPLPENLWWIVGGVVLTVAAVVVAWDLAETLRRAFTVAAVLVTTYGVYLLADNAAKAADARGAPWSIAPEALGALFATTFLAIEAGNVFPSFIVRIPAVLLLLAMIPIFFRVADEIEPLVVPKLPSQST